MHRNFLLQLLEKYRPTTEQEIYAKLNMQDFVNEHTDCFERSLLKGHITGSAVLLNRDLTEVLLMHHAKLDVWCQLGGHCDGEANVLEVALKEAQEESGINAITPISAEIFDLDVHHIPAMHGVPSHYHYDVRFLFKVDSNEQVLRNNESKDMRWFGLRDQLPTNAESILRMFRKLIDLKL